ncbi:histamine N-methyltransferase-like [Trichomycterus rosablanca]|uniref:histamine N-methyltransferase-like n=1 Tax=Trichomycterus rosablanca TaxID=2290929 RepID=UPI002F355E3B
MCFGQTSAFHVKGRLCDYSERINFTFRLCGRKHVPHPGGAEEPMLFEKTVVMTFENLADDYSTYQQLFEVYLEHSTDHPKTWDFIHGKLADILNGIDAGRSTLNVMGVGSGSGETDLEILRLLHSKCPEARVVNEVVEPSVNMLNKYKALLTQTAGIDHITFNWNQMTASDFKSSWKEKNPDKKMDFIHMVQMLYYVKDLEATVLFYQSLLKKNGKLLIILDTEDSGWNQFWKNFQVQLCSKDSNLCTTAEDIKSILDVKGITYQSYRIMSELDITKCFIAGDEKGELLMDFLTETMDFSKKVSPELKADMLELLKHPDCCRKEDGKIMLNSSLEALLIDA